MNAAAREIVAAWQMEPLAREGGYYRATWRNRTASAILFLITPEEFSALHRLAQDEIWHFHTGDAVEHAQFDPRSGTVQIVRLGADVLHGDSPQLVVPAGVWQGARVAGGGRGFALLGCTVSPPWEESGCEFAARESLTAAFPEQHEIIRALTR